MKPVGGPASSSKSSDSRSCRRIVDLKSRTNCREARFATLVDAVTSEKQSPGTVQWFRPIRMTNASQCDMDRRP